MADEQKPEGLAGALACRGCGGQASAAEAHSGGRASKAARRHGSYPVGQRSGARN